MNVQDRWNVAKDKHSKSAISMTVRRTTISCCVNPHALGSQMTPREPCYATGGTNQPSNLTSRHNEELLTEILSLRTVPVWLQANHRKVKVNAILDDASNETFLNEEVACRSTSHSRAFRDCQSACFK